MRTTRRARLAGHRAQLGHAAALPAPEQRELLDSVDAGRRGSRAEWSPGPGDGGGDGNRLAGDVEPFTDSADEAIGAVGGDPERGGFFDQGGSSAGVEPLESLEGEIGEGVERFLGFQGQGPVVAGTSPGAIPGAIEHG